LKYSGVEFAKFVNIFGLSESIQKRKIKHVKVECDKLASDRCFENVGKYVKKLKHMKVGYDILEFF
jgi:hypothetical protein